MIPNVFPAKASLCIDTEILKLWGIYKHEKDKCKHKSKKWKNTGKWEKAV